MRTRILAVLAGWLAAVFSVALIASLAIDTAGRQVTKGPIAVSEQRVITASATTEAPAPTVDSVTSAPRPTASAKVSATTRPVQQKITPKPTRTTPEPTRVPVTSTYWTIAGRVRATCSGPRITLEGGYVQPASGWSVRMQNGGPSQVRVLFKQEGRRSLLVVAVCVDGHPRFEQSRIAHRRSNDDGNSDGDGNGDGDQNEGDSGGDGNGGFFPRVDSAADDG